MEHISFFIFILLLQKSSNNQLYTARDPSSRNQNIPHFMSPKSGVQMTGRNLPLTTKKAFLEEHKAPFLKSIAIKKELMEFTQPPFKIPYTLKTKRLATNSANIRNNIPYLGPANYTQLKKINFELKNERKTQEEKRFADQSKVLDAKNKLKMLERELEIKRELGRAELELPQSGFVSKDAVKVRQPLLTKEYVIPEREPIKVKKPLFAKEFVISERDIFKVQPPLLFKYLPNRKPQSDNSDSSEDSSEKIDGEKLDLNYDLENDHDLRVKW